MAKGLKSSSNDRNKAVFEQRAALLHSAAMAQFVDFSSRPVPKEIMSQFVSKEESPNIGVRIPYWEFPSSPNVPLEDHEGQPLVIRNREDFVFGGRIMMAYLPAACRDDASLDPFSPQESLRAVVVGDHYLISSIGPDQDRDLNASVLNDLSEVVAATYDPTNGTLSSGDLFWGN